MNPKELLFAFERKYAFLYNIMVDGVPVYTCHRDAVLARLQGSDSFTPVAAEKGRVFPRRLLDGAVKLLRLKNRQTLIFTSSMYRRDKGRNLAAEYLMEQYPDGAVFEWPSRTDAYDSAYFSDPQRDHYCPLDVYVVLYKLYIRLFRGKYRRLAEECRGILAEGFGKSQTESEREEAAVAYLMEALPEAYAATACSQEIFKWLFRGYKNIRYAIDFWGSARENIIPVLPGNPESIELQHGIITGYHPGYIYPPVVKDCDTPFFRRTLLVYGEKTKELLTGGSIFDEGQVHVIGNPRIKRYKALYAPKDTARKLILFASQTYEQDGTASNYYESVIPFLKKIEEIIETDPRWAGYTLAVKLHPRENAAVKEKYRSALPSAQILGSESQLYEVLADSYIQFTVSSTTLFEAAEFDTPTVLVKFNQYRSVDIYGFDALCADTPEEIETILKDIKSQNAYEKYLHYLKEKTAQFM